MSPPTSRALRVGTLAAELLRPWRWPLFGALACVVAAAGLDLVPPLIMGKLVDEHLNAGIAEGLLGLAIAYLGALVAVQALRMVITILTATVAQGALRVLRVRLYDHLLRLPIAYHDTTPLGDTISRCTSDMETINSLFSLGIVNLLSQMVSLVAVVIAMIALSPALSLVMVILLPIVFVITRAFQVRMRGAERQVRRGVGLINARLQEILTGVEVVHALNRSARLLMAFRRTLLEALRATNLSVWYGSLYSPVMDVLAACAIAALFVLGGLPRDTGGWLRLGLSAGTLTSFVLLVNRFFDPIIALGEDWGTAQAALAGLERVFQVLGIPAEERPATGDTIGSHEAGDGSLVEIRNLWFGYHEGDPVLQDVSLRVARGKHLAIVGRTGAGKSSLFQLLGGLYRPWSGSIRIAGQDPFALSSESRRQILGPVPQSAQLFSGSVRDNLTMDDGDSDRPSAGESHGAGRGPGSLTDEDLLCALVLAGAVAFVRSLPQGLDTLLSDQGGGGGVQLSGGQRQLLALARALAANPLVLLLDEATASVDSATEATFRQAVRTHVQERGGAVITIAHRLATALEADEIVVLRDGRVVEQGSPQELLASGGLLASLWELERSGWS
ncbi:MAG: ABC transporter ATP-binding protein [Anaerolineae bacterium]